jgi:serine/threonine protein phosphatase 1
MQGCGLPPLPLYSESRLMQSYAIGDIHGHIDLLCAANDRIAADKAAHGNPSAPVVHIGDLVDRGPDCRAVVDYLMHGVQAGQPWVVLKGNHDHLFTLFLADPLAHDAGLRRDLSWLHPKIGGAATLASYGVQNAGDRPIAPVHAEAVAAVPQAHRDFLASRPTHFAHKANMFVHAGVRPGVAMADQAEGDLLWIRDGFLDYRGAYPWLLVHGHTAMPAAVHYGNRVNIDSSAAYGGPLTAVVIDGADVFVLTDAWRVALPVTPDAAIR